MCHSLSRICGGESKEEKRKTHTSQKPRPCKKSLPKTPQVHIHHSTADPAATDACRSGHPPAPSRALILSLFSLASSIITTCPPLSHSTSCSSSAGMKTAALPCIASRSFTLEQVRKEEKGFPLNSTPPRFSLAGLSESCPIVGVTYQEQHARLIRSSQTSSIFYTFSARCFPCVDAER